MFRMLNRNVILMKVKQFWQSSILTVSKRQLTVKNCQFAEKHPAADYACWRRLVCEPPNCILASQMRANGRSLLVACIAQVSSFVAGHQCATHTPTVGGSNEPSSLAPLNPSELVCLTSVSWEGICWSQTLLNLLAKALDMHVHVHLHHE